MNTPTLEELKALREKYPEGTKIRLLHMDDAQAPRMRSIGKVTCVDDIGTIHMKWESGSTLGIIDKEDKFEIVPNLDWIYVEDELPYEPVTDDGYVEPSHHVLVCTDAGHMYVTRYWAHRRSGILSDGEEWLDMNHPTTEVVIAWMPLPETCKPRRLCKSKR